MSSLSQQSVIVDGEAVTFEGPPPADLQQLYQLIDQALTAGGRLITAFEIDGIDAHKDPSSLQKQHCQCVSVNSSEWQTVCLNAITQLLPVAENAANGLIAYGSAMLAVPLAHSLNELTTVADKMGEVLAPIETANQFAEQFGPSWSTACKEVHRKSNQACDAFSESIKTQDIGQAAACLVVDLPSLFNTFRSIPETPWQTPK
ncbi:MAG: hypothetical protein AAF212_11025 [Verrucomicrobiota bacterium]